MADHPMLPAEDTVLPADLDFHSVSDYGSDFNSEEELLLSDLLLKLPIRSPKPQTPPVGEVQQIEYAGALRISRPLRQRPLAVGDSQTASLGHRPPPPHISIKVEGDFGSSNIESRDIRNEVEPASTETAAADSAVVDSRSPLLRFRTAPKKALSVTDLVSPSWCEIQYWYSLTKHGKKRRTPAMKQGSAVHQLLEDQVHKTVQVETQTREDSWALRIWNVIQGLRTLEATGMTRELEVWGIIDGLVVNGVIDELSYTCPDRELQEQAQAASTDKDVRSTSRGLPAGQTQMDTFLKASGAKSLAEAASRLKASESEPSAPRAQKVYITDVKTRASKALPSGAGFRPTLMQLMLYHYLLTNLATDKVDADQLFNRYRLNPSATFTDAFIAQISGLDEDVFYDDPAETTTRDEPYPALRPPDALEVLTTSNSLHQLWPLMIKTFQRVFPRGAQSVGEVLQAEYRNHIDGAIKGNKTFLYDENVLMQYVKSELSWWRGERQAVGVPVDEAYKCRMCEFADGCTWRIARFEEATTNHRLRARSVV